MHASGPDLLYTVMQPGLESILHYSPKQVNGYLHTIQDIHFKL